MLDMFRVNKFKEQLDLVTRERDQLKATLSETEHLQHFELRQAVASLGETRVKLEHDIEALRQKYSKEVQGLEQQVEGTKRRLQQQLADLEQQVKQKKQDLVEQDDQILLQSFGFYKPKYEMASSDLYKAKLAEIRAAQEEMVKRGRATHAPTNWTVNNSKAEGERMVKDYVKLIVRSFNNECDACMVAVKFNNVDSIEKRITKAFDTLNMLGKRMQISLVPEYLNLKLQELYLCHEYQVKKQEEKEEQRILREQLREEEKRQKEIEAKKLRIAKEETHFAQRLAQITQQLGGAVSEETHQALVLERAKIEEALVQIEIKKADVLREEQNTRAGYVYIISNVGAFGEEVYKIGVTRRLEPRDRIYELGDASVPFNFDIHALIFSEDAPALENALHKAFEHRRLNMINRRREFFKVSLQEIEQVVKQSHKKPAEFTLLADAPEYRQSLMLKQGQVL